MMKLVLLPIFFLMLVWRVRKGYQNGVIKEISNIGVTIAAVLNLILILLIFISFKSKKYSVLIVCVAALFVIGIMIKAGSVFFHPAITISHISIVSSFDRFLGVLLGIFEACIFAGAAYWLVVRFGTNILNVLFNFS